MIKIRTITSRGNKQNIQSREFDELPSFEALKTLFLEQVPWNDIEIKLDDVQRDRMPVINSDESLKKNCNGEMILSFFVCPFTGNRYEVETKRLVEEGFPLGKCRGLLKKFNGDVELVRNAFREVDEKKESVRILVDEGVPRKMAVRLMKRLKDVNLVRDHHQKIQQMDTLYGDIADRLIEEGYKQKKRCISLLSKFNGDVAMVKSVMDKQLKRKREKTEFESCQERKRKRSLELIDVKGDSLIYPDGTSFALDSSPDFFVEKIGRVYLDGNNMLYIEKEMRNLSIKGRTRIQAEKMLGNIALYFTQALNLRKDTFQMNLMFDTSSMHGITDVNFEIISGKVLGFNTADDALVSLSEEFQSELLSDTLFVTSDVELQNRLTERGALIMKPKTFLTCAKVLIGEETYQSILQEQTTLL